jgi:membrane protein YqaA with SNARE-associated domain
VRPLLAAPGLLNSDSLDEMSPFGWAEVLAMLSSVGFGVLSAIFPLANAEAFVVASQMSAVAGGVAVAIGVGVGQTIGKLTLFVGVRRGRQSRFFRHQKAKVRARPAGPARLRFRAAIHSLLALVGTKRWGLPIVFLAAVVGLPPLYAVALLAGATKMKILYFTGVVLVGRLARFLLVAQGVTVMHH